MKTMISLMRLLMSTEKKGKTPVVDNFLSVNSVKRSESRLQQNRKSAKKCRLKKKAEFGQMRGDVNKLHDENKNLKEKVTIFLNLILVDQ